MQAELDTEKVLASAIRFLIDGKEFELANLLLSCTLRLDKVSRVLEDDWLGDWVWLSLAGPRRVFEALTFPADFDFEDPRFDNYCKAKEAIESVLPTQFRLQGLERRVELVDFLDEHWREQLL